MNQNQLNARESKENLLKNVKNRSEPAPNKATQQSSETIESHFEAISKVFDPRGN